MSPRALRHTYTPVQLERYFAHIHLPQRFRPSASQLESYKSRTSGGPDLKLLQRLQRYHLATVPWENLAKFYKPAPNSATSGSNLAAVPSLLDGNNSFDHVVGREASGRLDGRGGRGGGCHVTNTMFGNVLRSLGYDVRPEVARIHLGDNKWSGWEHLTNFVAIDEHTYVVDVGFGAQGPIIPLPLEEQREHANIHPASAQLVRKTIHPPSVEINPNPETLWVYQYCAKSSLAESQPSSTRNAAVEKWRDIYAFADQLDRVSEPHANIHEAGASSALQRGSLFNLKIAAVRMIMEHEVPDILGAASTSSSPTPSPISPLSASKINSDGEGSDEIVGTMSLTTSRCKCTINGVDTTLARFKDEEERQEAIRKFFGIVFSEEEKAGVWNSIVAFEKR